MTNSMPDKLFNDPNYNKPTEQISEYKNTSPDQTGG